MVDRDPNFQAERWEGVAVPAARLPDVLVWLPWG